MEIKINTLPRYTIYEFGDRHNLEITINERERRFWWYGEGERFYASFDHSEIKIDGGMLKWEYGNGKTPNDAINNYARVISGKVLVVNAHCPERPLIEISVPELSVEV